MLSLTELLGFHGSQWAVWPACWLCNGCNLICWLHMPQESTTGGGLGFGLIGQLYVGCGVVVESELLSHHGPHCASWCIYVGFWGYVY